AAARVLTVGRYAAGRGCIGHAVEARGSRSPVATKHLRADDNLEAGEFQTDATAALIGNYLRYDLALGHPVTPTEVSPRQFPPKLANTIAAILTISKAEALKRGIAETSSVVIIRDGKPFGPPVTVLRMDCDQQSCTVIVGLEKM